MDATGHGTRGPVTVGVYDEPDLIVSGVHGLLSRSGPLAEVVSVPADAAAAEVDVLLCDPVGRARQLEDYLAAAAALTVAPVLVFSWSTSPSSVRRSLAGGARGFVSKSASSVDFAAAVTAVLRGEATAPPRPGRAGGRTPGGGGAELSPREAEVLELICRGLSNLEIAEQLFVSVNSVKTYVRQVYQKTGVTRRSQAVAWGLARGY